MVQTQPPVESSSPFRFGLKTLFALVTICGVQFALITHLGAFLGLLIGIAVCIMGLLILIFTGMLFAGSHSGKAIDRMDQLAIRLTVAVVVLFVGSILAGGGSLVYKQVGKYYLAAKIKKDLGFTFRRQYAQLDDEMVRVIVVTSVKPGGAFEKAGFRRQDIIVSSTPPYELLKEYDENRGQTVNVAVVSGPTLQSLDKCAQRNLSLGIPARR